jgi:hypothetical protein
VSGPLPGATHDLSAARILGILRELAAAGLIVQADKGYHGAGQPLLTPYKGRRKPESQKTSTAPTPGCAEWGNAPTPSSRHGASCRTTLLPLACRPSSQGNPCSSGPRDRRVKKAHWLDKLLPPIILRVTALHMHGPTSDRASPFNPSYTRRNVLHAFPKPHEIY